MSILKLAKELRLAEKPCTTDLALETIADEVLQDRQQAIQLGLRGTPMIFINGRRFEIENFNLAEDLDDWLKLEIQLTTGSVVEPASIKVDPPAPAASGSAAAPAAAGSPGR